MQKFATFYFLSKGWLRPSFTATSLNLKTSFLDLTSKAPILVKALITDSVIPLHQNSISLSGVNDSKYMTAIDFLPLKYVSSSSPANDKPRKEKFNQIAIPIIVNKPPVIVKILYFDFPLFIMFDTCEISVLGNWWETIQYTSTACDTPLSFGFPIYLVSYSFSLTIASLTLFDIAIPPLAENDSILHH